VKNSVQSSLATVCRTNVGNNRLASGNLSLSLQWRSSPSSTATRCHVNNAPHSIHTDGSWCHKTQNSLELIFPKSQHSLSAVSYVNLGGMAKTTGQLCRSWLVGWGLTSDSTHHSHSCYTAVCRQQCMTIYRKTSNIIRTFFYHKIALKVRGAYYT